MQVEERQIRAVFDDKTITVYQAYNKAIAESAVKHQTFVSPPFKMDRMTWIKPSFLWMMYRSGWATKPDQKHILAIKITREGFEWALQNACLSHFDPDVHESREAWKEQLQNSPVRIQWDPERDIHMNKLDYRAVQIGLSGVAVKKYAQEWIQEIEDVTNTSVDIYKLLQEDRIQQAANLLPDELIYSIQDSLESCS
jgi:hypothetical protein